MRLTSDHAEQQEFHKAPEAKVLVVDDIDTNLLIVESLLETFAIRVDTCTSGQEAVSLVEKNDYDLVLMDHIMPGMDGLVATQRIRALESRHSTVPIAALTANDTDGIREFFLENGFSDFLLKPVELLSLEALLHDWIPPGKWIAAAGGAPKSDDALFPIAAEGLDVKSGVARTGGTFDKYMAILATYCSEAKRMIPLVRNCVTENDFRNFTVLMHSLKSTSASIGAEELSGLAKSLEEAGRDECADFIRQRTAPFLESLEALIGEIMPAVDEFRQKRAAEKGGERTSLQKGLVELKQALTDFSPSLADRILCDLMSLGCGDRVYNALSAISDSIVIADYDTAIVEIEKLLCDNI